jgi:transcriptional regulator with XRE-family HTH domain
MTDLEYNGGAGMTPAELKAARKALGITQDQLASLMGVSRASVMRMEAGGNSHPAMAHLLAAYAAGYRPADWPTARR